MQDLRAWRSERGVFSVVAGYGWQVQQALTTPRGGVRLANGIEATAGLLRLFGVDPQAGRGFLASDFAPAAAPVMLAAPAVERQFRRAARIGGELRLGASNYRVVGTLPPASACPMADSRITSFRLLPPAGLLERSLRGWRQARRCRGLERQSRYTLPVTAAREACRWSQP